MKNFNKNLIFFLPNFSKGGASYAILRLCEHLNKKNYKLNVICIGNCELKNDLKKHKVKIHEINSISTFNSISKLKDITKKIINSTKCKSIFISNHHYANVISMMALKNIEVKKILIERTSLEQLKRAYNFKDFIKKRIILCLIKIFYPSSDLVIANSKRESQDIKKFCNSKTIHIYPAAYKKIEIKNKKKFKKKINILNVGSLIKEKGINTIIEAINILDNKNIHLDVLGKGYDQAQDEGKNLLKLSEKYNLQKQIKFHGFKNDLKKFYVKADLYINSSHCEGFSSAVVEAMNYNVPVICSDAKGGNREIVAHGKAGFLFKVDDINDLKNKITICLNKQQNYNRKIKYAKKHIQQFNYLNNFSKYKKIFKKI